jgi:hypothetical protein
VGVSPSARPGGDPPRAYGALARWLARAIPATPRRLAEVEATGRDIGHELASSNGDPVAAITDLTAALGFQPATARPEPGRLQCTLRNCP